MSVKTPTFRDAYIGGREHDGWHCKRCHSSFNHDKGRRVDTTWWLFVVHVVACRRTLPRGVDGVTHQYCCGNYPWVGYITISSGNTMSITNGTFWSPTAPSGAA